MQTIKNQVVTLTTEIKPEAQFRVVISAAKTAAEASRMLVCSIVAFLLNVNYYRTGKDDLYLSREKAIEFIKAEIAKQATIKGGMLDRYVNYSADLYGRITAPGGSKFKPLINECVKLKDADKVVARLFKWMDQEAGVKSFTDLSMTLGYSVGNNAPTGGTKGKKQTPTKKVESLGTTIEKLASVVNDKKNHVTNTQVNQVIAKKVADPLDLAMQGIRAYAAQPDADPDKLFSIIKLVEKVADALLSRVKAQKKATKAKPQGKAKAHVIPKGGASASLSGAVHHGV